MKHRYWHNIEQILKKTEFHKQLESEGVLEVEITTFNNRKRKYYFLTQKGKEEKVTRLKELESFLNTMQSLINSKSLT